jgi:hypothetical protein
MGTAACAVHAAVCANFTSAEGYDDCMLEHAQVNTRFVFGIGCTVLSSIARYGDQLAALAPPSV